MRIACLCFALVAGCGGGAAAPDAPPPVLEVVAQAPGPFASFWRHTPIEVQFSAALDPTTIGDASVVVEVDGVTVARGLSISNDGTTLTLTPTVPPAVGTTVRLRLSDTIRSTGGLPFAGASMQWPVPEWIVDDNIHLDDTPWAFSGLALDESGHPVMTAIDPGSTSQVWMWRWSWRISDWLPDFMVIQRSWTERTEQQVVVDAEDRPVVAWTDEWGTYGTFWWYDLNTVRWDAPALEESVLPTDTQLDGLTAIQLYRHGDTILRATLRGGINLRVCELSSSDTWVPCYPNPITSTIYATQFRLASLGTTLALALKADGADGIEIFLKQTAGWTLSPDVVGTIQSELEDAVADANVIYVGYNDVLAGLVVAQVDGVSGEITMLGGALNATPVGMRFNRLALALGNGILYAAWAERGTTDTLHLARWTGTEWTPITPPVDPRAGEVIESVRLEVDPWDNLIAVYGGGPAGAPIRTARYNGN